MSECRKCIHGKSDNPQYVIDCKYGAFYHKQSDECPNFMDIEKHTVEVKTTYFVDEGQKVILDGVGEDYNGEWIVVKLDDTSDELLISLERDEK